jgi:hypothetical protein
MTEQQENTSNPCGCGRSPTGQCCGWHNLSEEQFQVKLNEYFKEQDNKSE